MKHERAERSVLIFAAVILIAGVANLTSHNSRSAIICFAIGLAMIAVTEWAVWRRQ